MATKNTKQIVKILENFFSYKIPINILIEDEESLSEELEDKILSKLKIKIKIEQINISNDGNNVFGIILTENNKDKKCNKINFEVGSVFKDKYKSLSEMNTQELNDELNKCIDLETYERASIIKGLLEKK